MHGTGYRLSEDGKIDIGDSIIEIAKHVSQQPTSTSIEKDRNIDVGDRYMDISDRKVDIRY